MSIIAQNLISFVNNELELVIDTDTGESFASQSAVARMCKVSETAIRKWIGSNQTKVINAKINTQGGLQGSNLLDENAIFEAFEKYNPSLLVQCAKAGIRVYLHKLAGYTVSSTATKPLSPAEMHLQQAQMMLDYERQLAGHNQRLEVIEQLQAAAREKLYQLPPATVEAEALTTRFALNRLVREYAIANNLHYAECWAKLYLEHRDRTHVDIKARARNYKPKINCCEYAEKYGYIEQLYAIGLEIFI